ncbi:MAG: hypothetical protein ABSE73_03395 [Planctomycetota bacterium]
MEPRYICKDYRNLFSHFYSKKFVERTPCCSRLHFFGASDLDLDHLLGNAKQHSADYLGYSVIQPVRERCIGRTVVDPLRIGNSQDSFFCLRTLTTVHLNGAKYEVSGYPFFSQSGEATVCAHVALWGVCRYLSDRYPAYGEVYPYDIIQMTSSMSGRRVPYRGMTYSDYCEILSAFGCHPVALRMDTDQKSWTQDPQTFYDLYSYVESGFPVLASYGGHVVTIVGHTTQNHVGIHSKDTGQFYNSFSLVKQFIVVDDNFFPYRLLGYSSDPDNYGAVYKGTGLFTETPSIDSITTAVVPLPEKAFMPPDIARRLAYNYFGHHSAQNLTTGLLEKLKIPPDEPLIARLFLTSGSQFKKRKRQSSAGGVGGVPDRLAMLPVDLRLPHFIWVMEISPLTLYNQGLCFGEVLLDASANEAESEYIYMRLGNTVFCGGEQSPCDDGLLQFVQYTHNLGERDA